MRAVGDTAAANRLVLLISVVAGCVAVGLIGPRLLRVIGTDYAIGLPHGYELVRTHGDCVLLVGPSPHGDGRLLVNPAIVGYAIKHNLIIGRVRFVDHEAGSRAGYFVVNMENGEVSAGLSASVWLKRLEEHGIREKPRLVRPSRWRAIL